MRFTCSKCKFTLSRQYGVDFNANMFVCPWYRDETGTNHIAVLCLNCRTLHDTRPSLIRILFTFFRRPLKLITFVPILELKDLLVKTGKDKNTSDTKSIAINYLRLPEELVEVYLDLSIIKESVRIE